MTYERQLPAHPLRKLRLIAHLYSASELYVNGLSWNGVTIGPEPGYQMVIALHKEGKCIYRHCGSVLFGLGVYTRCCGEIRSASAKAG